MDAYASFAQRIADSVTEVRGCLILSRDGFVLGSYPDEDEGLAKSAWLRFAGLGESERGVVEFQSATWAFVHRGPYSAFAVAVAGVRPGVLIDRIEDVLAEAERARGQVGRSPEDSAAPIPPAQALASAPAPVPIEAPAHLAPPPAAAPAPGPIETAGEPEPAGAPVDGPHVTPGQVALDLGAVRDPEPDLVPVSEVRVEPEAAPETLPESESQREPIREMEVLLASAELTESPPPIPQRGDGDDSEVDRVLLAKEFSGLLQVDRPDDEVSR